MHSTVERRLNRQASTGQKEGVESTSRRNPRVLFVDDDPDIQTTLEMRLRPYAVDVQHAFFGTQGIVAAIKKKPDLILMDMAMPNGNGEYLLETIKRNEATATIPVIVFTGMRDPTIRNHVMRLGAEGFLSKPASFDDLLHEIGRFIEIRRRRPRRNQR